MSGSVLWIRIKDSAAQIRGAGAVTGLAKHFGDSGLESADLSRTQAVRGTVGYMAPEQAESAKLVGPSFIDFGAE